jgi:hypothetical protein
LEETRMTDLRGWHTVSQIDGDDEDEEEEGDEEE